MTTIEITPERLTVIKHLASGKGIDVVATITRLPRARVVDIGAHHGYPDTEKLTRAAELMQARLDRDAAAIPERQPQTAGTREVPVAPPTASPRVITSPKPPPIDPSLTKPDEIRVLLNTAKQHPAKRIQTQADRVFDALDKLRGLIRDDEEKNAAKRKAEADKAAARAQVQQLEQQLRDAKAKLRTTTSAPKTTAEGEGPSAADIRDWAAGEGIECPTRGRVPQAIRQAYDEAHPVAAAS